MGFSLKKEYALAGSDFKYYYSTQTPIKRRDINSDNSPNAASCSPVDLSGKTLAWSICLIKDAALFGQSYQLLSPQPISVITIKPTSAIIRNDIKKARSYPTSTFRSNYYIGSTIQIHSFELLCHLSVKLQS